MDANADFLFEISWEVCNKIGGIFTVVKSKIEQMQAHYGEHFYLIGPYIANKAHGMFDEEMPPDELKGAFESLKQEGIEVHYGTWLVKGNPKVFLVDFTSYMYKKDEVKKNLWDWYNIDSLFTEYHDFDIPITWSYAAGRLLQEINSVFPKKKIVAHCHEWLSGSTLLYLKKQKLPIATVFTTHATTLGRSLALANRNLYKELEKLDPDSEARNLGPSVFAKHMVEKQSAQQADIFTTVSEITGIEAERILGRKPDVLLPNGLDMSRFPSFEQSSIRHNQLRERIKQFIMFYFFPYYQFDIENTLIYFLAGRYEFRDKGIDIYLNALARLNEKLKAEKSKKTIVAFLWVPGNVKSIQTDLIQNRTLFMDVKESLDDNFESIRSNLLRTFLMEKELTKETLFGPDFLEEMKPKLKRLKRQGDPPLMTHEIYDQDRDPIVQTMLSAGLDNKADDPVKVIFYPIYLTGADGLLDTNYYESMQGSHLGVFPSYYEPWGYTPLEAGALGVSSVTTDLAGFGRYLCKECEQGRYPGIFVLERFKKSDEEIINDLTEFMYRFSKFTTKERVANKIAAQRAASTADWKNFIENYIDAHNKALGALK